MDYESRDLYSKTKSIACLSREFARERHQVEGGEKGGESGSKITFYDKERVYVHMCERGERSSTGLLMGEYSV